MSEPLRVDPGVLASYRRARGLSKKALADAAGLDYSSYWRIEQGRAQNPRVDTVQRIAGVLEVPVEALTAPAGAVMATAPAESGRLDPLVAAAEADALFFGLFSEIVKLTPEERASVLPVLREIVERRERGAGSARSRRARARGAD